MADLKELKDKGCKDNQRKKVHLVYEYPMRNTDAISTFSICKHLEQNL